MRDWRSLLSLQQIRLLGEVWDVVAVGLTFPLALALIGGVAGGQPPADPAILARLPYGMILIAAVFKLIGQPHFPNWRLSYAMLGGGWAALFHLVPMFWVLFLVGRIDALSPLLLLAAWAVLSLLLAVPRIARYAAMVRVDA